MSNDSQLVRRDERPQIVTLLSSDRVRDEMALVIPPGVNVDVLMSRAKAAVLASPKLLECTPQSILLAVKKSIGCGLELNGRDCHLVPFKEQGTAKAQFIIDAKGYIALGLRCGMKLITSELVCEAEFGTQRFRRWTDDAGRHLFHEPDDSRPRGKVVGAYSYTKNAAGEFDYEYMPVEEIDAIKRRSAGFKFGTGPWITDENEMRRKTVIRRHSKRWDIDTRFKRAMQDDDDQLADQPEAAPIPAMILPGDEQKALPAPEQIADKDLWEDEK